mmetsp:Transcript_20202/g.57796  ORF Transcript_20202/g.57796 Transcript_20202/m.57796 type:complete len:274 (+) Transcript_20202:637-1458(+)
MVGGRHSVHRADPCGLHTRRCFLPNAWPRCPGAPRGRRTALLRAEVLRRRDASGAPLLRRHAAAGALLAATPVHSSECGRDLGEVPMQPQGAAAADRADRLRCRSSSGWRRYCMDAGGRGRPDHARRPGRRPRPRRGANGGVDGQQCRLADAITCVELNGPGQHHIGASHTGDARGSPVRGVRGASSALAANGGQISLGQAGVAFIAVPKEQVSEPAATPCHCHSAAASATAAAAAAAGMSFMTQVGMTFRPAPSVGGRLGRHDCRLSCEARD